MVAVAVSARAAHRDDRELVRRLLAGYLPEFDGRTDRYPYFEEYRSDPERLPLLLECDVAGFCLVRVREGGWSSAEFWVSRGRLP